MKRRHSLRDIFNLKAAKRGVITLSLAAAFSGCTAIPTHAQVVPGLKVASHAGCVATPQAPKIPHDEELMRENDDQPPSQAVRAMNADQRMQYYMNKFCFTMDQVANDNNPRDAWLVSALDALKGVTFMGKPLIDLAADSHLKFCALHHMPAGTGAEYWPSHKFVAAGHNSKPQGEVLDLAHEITHAAQDQHGLLDYDYAWDIQSRVRRDLATEAAPIAMEFSVAYEKKLEGDPSYWNFLKTRDDGITPYTDPKNRHLFEKTYRQNAERLPADALRAAAHAVFERVFESQSWRRFYMTSVLNSYVEDIADGKFHEFRDVERNAFGQDRVDLAGEIGNLPSYTKGAHMPKYEDLFKGDRKMRWAFEAADIARYRQSLGANDPKVRDMVATAEAGKNPYLNIDFEELNRRVAAAAFAPQFKPTWQLMDEMMKDGLNTAPKPCVVPVPVVKPAPPPPAA